MSPLGKIATDGTLVPFADLDQSTVDLASENARLKKLLAAKDAEISDRDDTIEQLKTQLSPDIASLIAPLQEAGLTAWGDAAVTAGDNLMPLVLRLLSIASQPRYRIQCQEIKDLFGTIGQASGVWPTPEQATAMQAILDSGTLTTGPVGEQWLNFRRWM